MAALFMFLSLLKNSLMVVVATQLEESTALAEVDRVLELDGFSWNSFAAPS